MALLKKLRKHQEKKFKKQLTLEIIKDAKMNNAYKYISKQLENEEFKKQLYLEKLKIDIEILADELKENIKSDKSKAQLVKGVNKIKRAVAQN